MTASDRQLSLVQLITVFFIGEPKVPCIEGYIKCKVIKILEKDFKENKKHILLTYYFKTETFLSSYLWCATAVKLCMPTPWLINFSCAAHISVKLVDNDASDLKLSRKSLLLN